MALQHQRIVPTWSISTISWILPYLEITLACALVLGIMPNLTAVAVLLIFIIFCREIDPFVD